MPIDIPMRFEAERLLWTVEDVTTELENAADLVQELNEFSRQKKVR